MQGDKLLDKYILHFKFLMQYLKCLYITMCIEKCQIHNRKSERYKLK